MKQTCHIMLGVLGASFLLNPVSTRLETRVKAADVQPVRVSAAKKLEKCYVIERHYRRQHARLLQYLLTNQGISISSWHQSQGRKQKRKSEDGGSLTSSLGQMDREPHPDVGFWHED
jgi:hypothetical protein